MFDLRNMHTKCKHCNLRKWKVTAKVEVYRHTYMQTDRPTTLFTQSIHSGFEKEASSTAIFFFFSKDLQQHGHHGNI